MARHALARRLAAVPSIAFLKLLRALPMPVGRALTQSAGRMGLLLVPRLKRVGMENLGLAYGDSLSRAEKRQILREAMDNICAVAAEMPHAHDAVASGASPIVLQGLEHLDRTRGGLLISAHIGNWEWMPPVLGHAGFRILVVVRPFDDPQLNALVDKLRQSDHVKMLPKNEAGPALVAHMLEGHFSGIMVDQSPRENAVPTTFFGQPCWSTIGPAMVATRAQLPVYPIEIYRTAPGRYVAQLHPPVEIQNTGNTLEDLVVNTQRCQDIVEGWIRERPGHWLWFHRRWKKRPRLEEEWAARVEKKRQQRAAEEMERS